jgi:hypothetical protein
MRTLANSSNCQITKNAGLWIHIDLMDPDPAFFLFAKLDPDPKADPDPDPNADPDSLPDLGL